MKVCPVPGCPTLVQSGRCPDHRAQYERERGTRQQRGYGAAHQRERARWANVLRTTTLTCPRCGQPVTSTDAWDLGHTDDRTSWTGPEHATCNRSAGGRAAHQGGG